MNVEASRQDPAERLSQWLDAFSAVRMDAALHSIKALADQAPTKAQTPHLPQSPQLEAVNAELQRVHAAVVKGISACDFSHAEPKYAPYLQRYLEQQRQMESKVGPLRAHVRQVLARGSTELKQLATLDTVMEQMLGAREQKLLSSIPVFLEKRFEHWRKTQQQESQQQDDPDLWRQPGGWLHSFGREWQEVLLAELDVRLQPVMGLIEALGNEVGKQ